MAESRWPSNSASGPSRPSTSGFGLPVRAGLGVAALVPALLAGGAAACGGAAGAQGSFEGGVYRDGPVAFQVGQVPATWRRVKVTDASLAFRDDVREASVLVNARCKGEGERTPLVALTNQLIIGSTDREFRSQEVEPFDGREALHTQVQAKFDGVPMALDLFVVSKDGCVYDLVYTAPPAVYAEGAPEFERFARGFRTLRGSGVVP